MHPAMLHIVESEQEQLHACLNALTPRTEGEAADLARARVRVNEGAAWDRETTAHFTASALIVHPPTKRVLLRWHERQDAWIQVGGHGDPGETDPVAIAIREAIEETGLADLAPWPTPRLVHVVAVHVPANVKEPDHVHIDLRFVLATLRPDDAVPEAPSAPVRWLSVADAMSLTTEDNVRETIRRVGESLG